MNLIAKLRKADHPEKTNIWIDADLSVEETNKIIRKMVLSLPPWSYHLHGREYGLNLIDEIYKIYGWMPSMLISESFMLGMSILYPDKIRVAFTHDMDQVTISKPTKTMCTNGYNKEKI
jgi:hypothetical protein